jgi:phage terminase small subunit
MSKAKPTRKAGPRKAAAPAAKQSKTELREDRFIAEYLVDYNGRQAAIRAGYAPQAARQTASELLAKPHVQAKLQAAQEKVLDGLGVTVDLVMSRLHAIATADPRELTELHRGCCRYCWGVDNLFQRTPREMREARANWEANEAAKQMKEGAAAPVPFDEAGGIGYNPRRDPNPECPECFGDGEARAVLKDTRDLSPVARLLFAGVEQTQHGLKVRMHSQPDALVHIGKQLGMFTRKVEHSGPGGSPIQQAHTVIRDLLDQVDGDTGPGPAASRRR